MLTTLSSFLPQADDASVEATAKAVAQALSTCSEKVAGRRSSLQSRLRVWLQAVPAAFT